MNCTDHADYTDAGGYKISVLSVKSVPNKAIQPVRIARIARIRRIERSLRKVAEMRVRNSGGNVQQMWQKVEIGRNVCIFKKICISL